MRRKSECWFCGEVRWVQCRWKGGEIACERCYARMRWAEMPEAKRKAHNARCMDWYRRNRKRALAIMRDWAARNRKPKAAICPK